MILAHFLTCIQVSQPTDKVVWYFHLFKNFPQFVEIHSIKGFSVVNEAAVDILLKVLCFLHDPMNVGSLISGSSVFNSTYTSGSSQFMYCWSPAWMIFEHNFANMWNECKCTVVWTFFIIALLRDWNKNWPFPVLWPLMSFPNLLPYWV